MDGGGEPIGISGEVAQCIGVGTRGEESHQFRQDMVGALQTRQRFQVGLHAYRTCFRTSDYESLESLILRQVRRAQPASFEIALTEEGQHRSILVMIMDKTISIYLNLSAIPATSSDTQPPRNFV